jgi:hypothetical protein
MSGVQDTPGAEGPSAAGFEGAVEGPSWTLRRRESAAQGRALWIGAGPRQAELCAVLNALRPGCCVPVDDLYELPGRVSDAFRAPLLVLDGDHCALEDIGWIRRLVATGRVAAVVAMGTDPGARVARTLRTLPGARWAPWPPDLEELKALLASVDGPNGAGAPRASSGPDVERSNERRAERSGEPRAERCGEPRAERSGEPRAERDLELVAQPPTGARSPAANPHAGAGARSGHESGPDSGHDAASTALSLTIGRDHVAVLADISQRLELAFLGLRESGCVPDSDLEGPVVELRRLLRFTRSLACLAAPPPRGADEFEVTGLIEELLATLTLRGRKGPRFQPSSGPIGKAALEFIVRADRAALTMAFETVLSLARLCSSGGDTVRVTYTPLNGSALSIGIEFPAGPLHDVRPERLLDVAVLRERLPDLDPNELVAAAAILRSQGGGMEVLVPAEGQLAIRMRLPVERSTKSAGTAVRPDSARGEGAKPAGRAPRTRVDDPFA